MVIKNKVHEFIETVSCDRETAQKYLRKNGWDVNAALNDYLNEIESGIAQVPDAGGPLEIFNELATMDEGNGIVGPNGVKAFCKNLGITPVDPEVLVFSYQCQASKMGQFTQAEFLQGMAANAAVSWETLTAAVPQWRDNLMKADTLRPIYRWMFGYFTTEQQASTNFVAADIAVAFWELLLPAMEWPITTSWLEYIRERFVKAETPRPVSRDLWNATFDFLKTTTAESVIEFNFDESAWPTAVDDFVAWWQETQPKGTA